MSGPPERPQTWSPDEKRKPPRGRPRTGVHSRSIPAQFGWERVRNDALTLQVYPENVHVLRETRVLAAEMISHSPSAPRRRLQAGRDAEVCSHLVTGSFALLLPDVLASSTEAGARQYLSIGAAAPGMRLGRSKPLGLERTRNTKTPCQREYEGFAVSEGHLNQKVITAIAGIFDPSWNCSARYLRLRPVTPEMCPLGVHRS